MADQAGIEFLLPIAKWYGLGAPDSLWSSSLETFTQSAALGALTKRIGLFVTAHVSLLTPAFVAKAIATIDHITHGRAGLNIVCGWNADEFRLHGVSLEGEHRYPRGREWFRIYDKLLRGGPEFDWDGEFYQMRGLSTSPLPIQRPRPPIMSAGQSGEGQQFAADIADILFTAMHSYGQIDDTCQRLRQSGKSAGRTHEVYVTTQFVCRPTRKEAEEYAHYYAVERADTAAIEYLKRAKTLVAGPNLNKGSTAADRATAETLQGTRKRPYPGILPMNYAVIGSPDDIVEELKKLASVGVSGSTLIFLNYAKEMPYFIQEVIPRMERQGLRIPFQPT